jgi:hypothetical protein
VLEDFTKQTGIRVRYDTFDPNDTLETKLLAGNPVTTSVPTAYFLERQIKAGVFRNSTRRSSRTSSMSGRRSPSGSPCTIPATNTPSITWGTAGICLM